MRRSLLAAVLLALAACTDAPDASTKTEALAPPTLTRLDTPADSVRWIGIHPVDRQTVWLAGTHGHYAVTTTGGTRWRVATVPDADTLQFRDVHAADTARAYLLSIGPGASSRVFATQDGGQTWQTSFVNSDPDAFYDCFGFWDAESGIAFSDAVDGVFPVIVTEDGGATWTPVPAEALPAALPGEGSFAASGTCLVARGDSTAWFGTGASTRARVFKTTNRGRTWQVVDTPLQSGEAAGIASLAFADAVRGAALGGDIANPDSTRDHVAVTEDGGATWSLAASPDLGTAVYGASYVSGAPTLTLVAVGPGGIAFSTDNAGSWTTVDTLEHWSVAFAGRTGWAVGPNGRVTRLDF